MKLASRKRQKLLKRPWLSKGILISIKRKQKMYKTHILSNNEKLITFYKKYCAKLNKYSNTSGKRFPFSSLICSIVRKAPNLILKLFDGVSNIR